MSKNLSNKNDIRGEEFTIWVVVKQSQFEDEMPEVEEQGFFDEKNAKSRVAHVVKHDGVQAWPYPVRFYWPFKPTEPTGGAAPINPTPISLGPVTTKPGLEMHAYHVPSEAPRRLSQIVGDAWLSWRQQQASVGNLDEAGQEQPSADQLSRLYDEDAPNVQHQPEQLQLPI